MLTTQEKLNAIASANAGLDAVLAGIPDELDGFEMFEAVGVTLLENPNGPDRRRKETYE